MQEIEFFSGQHYRATPGHDLAALWKEPDPTDAEDVASMFAYATENRFHTQDKLAWAEGLHHIIVRADFESYNAIDLFGASRKHNDRNASGAITLAKVSADFQTVNVRQHDVKDDQIGWMFLDAIKGQPATYRRRYLKSGLVQVVADKALDVGIIVHDQDAFHAGYPGLSLKI